MRVEFHKLHRQLALILFLPLLASALTGVAYRLGKSLFKIPNLVENVLMTIHQGEYLGKRLVPIYILLIGLGVVGMSLTGINLLARGSSDRAEQTKLTTRSIHRLLGLILLLPLSISAETGIAYRLARDWFDMSSEQVKFLLEIHQGLYLGTTFSAFYVPLLGSSLVALLIAGIKMTSLGRSQMQQRQRQSPAPPLSQSTLSNTIVWLRRKAWLGITLFLIVFCVIFYGVTSWILSKKYNVAPELETQPTYYDQDLLILIGVVGLVVGVLGLIIVEKLIQNWRRQKEIQADLYEREAASSTLLRAFPDSLLVINQDGKCLRYMPPKETNSFILQGDILGKNMTEFLPGEIAQQLIKYSRLAFESGTTQVFQFPISLDEQRQYQEAQITTIKDKEFLVIMREIADLEPAKTKQKKYPHQG